MQNYHTSSPQKIRVGILFGGQSAEHEVSVQSAQNIVAALDTTAFEPVLIGIDRQGGWHLFDNPQALQDITAVRSQLPGVNSMQLFAELQNPETRQIDVMFPALHGPFGEDGTVQGLLELAGIPYVGCGVLSSAVAMDKDVAKRLLRDAGVPIADFVTLTIDQRHTVDTDAVQAQLGLPLFVKPANMGSSIGVSKVVHTHDLQEAIDHAFQYDTTILLEKAIIGDEIECAVLGTTDPRASVPGRIVPSANFYTYRAKYHDEAGTMLEIPAALSADITKAVQAVALKTFAVLRCRGLARVDMFVTTEGQIFVNEVNTMPGFTRFSMYPQLWEASGTSYTELITQLIQLALESRDDDAKIAT